MSKIGLVVDSTADLPLEYYRDNDVEMVPLTTRFEEKFFKDWVELSPKEFYKKLRKTDRLPKTSQPTVAEFLDVYRKLEAECQSILSVHLSSKLSGTVQSAEIASKEIKIPLDIIDTQMVSAGLGLIVDRMVELRKEGSSRKEMMKEVSYIIKNIKCVGSLDTLKYLEMGGRIGKARAFLGTLLDFKPILTITEGEIAPLKRVRGRKKVMGEMVNQMKELMGQEGEIFLALAHGDNENLIDEFNKEFKKTGFKVVKRIETEIGSVIGTYAGPDCLLAFAYPIKNKKDKALTLK